MAPPPGALAPAVPTSAALAEVRAVLAQQADQIDRLDKDSMRALLPALVDARNELRRGLQFWLSQVPDGEQRFTAQQMRRALASLEVALERVKALEPDMMAALAGNAAAAGQLSVQNLTQQVARFGAAFGESVYPTDLELAAVLARGDRLLMRHYRTSAARYAGQVGEDIRHQLAVGVAKNETFSQLKARLVRLGGPTGWVATRGVLGDPGAVAEHIAEGLFRRHRYWAERLVRTELITAYNIQHQQGMELLNESRDPARTAEYVQRWDSSLDKRACPICRDLDRRVAKVGGEFKGGYKAPPAHPNCRCVVVAWHVSWGDMAGEVPAVVDATDPLPSLPILPTKRPRAPVTKAPPGDPIAAATAHAARAEQIAAAGVQLSGRERGTAQRAAQAAAGKANALSVDAHRAGKTELAAALKQISARAWAAVDKFKAAAAQVPAPETGPTDAGMFAHRMAGGKWKDARDTLQTSLAADGFTPRERLIWKLANHHVAAARVDKVSINKRLGANGTFQVLDGKITLRGEVAARAQAFGREIKADPAAARDALAAAGAGNVTPRTAAVAAYANGARTMVHETFHGFGPQAPGATKGIGVFVEEMATEFNARAWMRESYGMPRSLFDRDTNPLVACGGYRGWCIRLIDHLEDGGMSRDDAVSAIERAAAAYKKQPAQSITTPDASVQAFARLLPGDPIANERGMRRISHFRPFDESRLPKEGSAGP